MTNKRRNRVSSVICEFRTKKKIMQLFQCSPDPTQTQCPARLTALPPFSDHAISLFGTPIEGDAPHVGVLQLDLTTWHKEDTACDDLAPSSSRI